MKIIDYFPLSDWLNIIANTEIKTGATIKFEIVINSNKTASFNKPVFVITLSNNIKKTQNIKVPNHLFAFVLF